VRPALRGTLHLVATVGVLAGGAWLLLRADSPRSYVGVSIFIASLLLVYAVSGVYHQAVWSPRVRRVLKRVDHALIFTLIAGTYTPFCLNVSLAWGIPVLAVVWGIAGAGAALKLLWPDAPRWPSVALYIALGWLALVATPELLDAFTALPLALLAGGGALYTVGGVVYALGRPDPWPRVFGYHEVFHAFVVAGSAMHFSLVAIFIV
jgi:hemolysin III